jgi:type IV secretion system protein VirB5
MKPIYRLALALPVSLMLCANRPTQASMPVIDISAISQLVSQLHTLQSQLATARDQLAEAHNTLSALSGPRGMEQLLASAPRNYLPQSWNEMSDTLANLGSAYGALASDIQRLIATNSVLAPAQLQMLTATQQQLIAQSRQQAAGLAAVARAALATSSQRFGSLQGLITAISTASDAKGIYDLQARIQAENGMLQNEATKLQALYQAQAAQAALLEQQVREQGIADAGNLRTLPALALH